MTDEPVPERDLEDGPEEAPGEDRPIGAAERAGIVDQQDAILEAMPDDDQSE